MKAVIRMTHTVDVWIEGEDEESIMEWAQEHTPEEVVTIAQKQGVEWACIEDYKEAMIIRDDSNMGDYVKIPS